MHQADAAPVQQMTFATGLIGTKALVPFQLDTPVEDSFGGTGAPHEYGTGMCSNLGAAAAAAESCGALQTELARGLVEVRGGLQELRDACAADIEDMHSRMMHALRDYAARFTAQLQDARDDDRKAAQLHFEEVRSSLQTLEDRLPKADVAAREVVSSVFDAALQRAACERRLTDVEASITILLEDVAQNRKHSKAVLEERWAADEAAKHGIDQRLGQIEAEISKSAQKTESQVTSWLEGQLSKSGEALGAEIEKLRKGAESAREDVVGVEEQLKALDESAEQQIQDLESRMQTKLAELIGVVEQQLQGMDVAGVERRLQQSIRHLESNAQDFAERIFTSDQATKHSLSHMEARLAATADKTSDECVQRISDAASHAKQQLEALEERLQSMEAATKGLDVATQQREQELETRIREILDARVQGLTSMGDDLQHGRMDAEARVSALEQRLQTLESFEQAKNAALDQRLQKLETIEPAATKDVNELEARLAKHVQACKQTLTDAEARFDAQIAAEKMARASEREALVSKADFTQFHADSQRRLEVLEASVQDLPNLSKMTSTAIANQVESSKMVGEQIRDILSRLQSMPAAIQACAEDGKALWLKMDEMREHLNIIPADFVDQLTQIRGNIASTEAAIAALRDERLPEISREAAFASTTSMASDFAIRDLEQRAAMIEEGFVRNEKLEEMHMQFKESVQRVHAASLVAEASAAAAAAIAADGASELTEIREVLVMCNAEEPPTETSMDCKSATLLRALLSGVHERFSALELSESSVGERLSAVESSVESIEQNKFARGAVGIMGPVTFSAPSPILGFDTRFEALEGRQAQLEIDVRRLVDKSLRGQVSPRRGAVETPRSPFVLQRRLTVSGGGKRLMAARTGGSSFVRERSCSLNDVSGEMLDMAQRLEVLEQRGQLHWRTEELHDLSARLAKLEHVQRSSLSSVESDASDMEQEARPRRVPEHRATRCLELQIPDQDPTPGQTQPVGVKLPSLTPGGSIELGAHLPKIYARLEVLEREKALWQAKEGTRVGKELMEMSVRLDECEDRRKKEMLDVAARLQEYLAKEISDLSDRFGTLETGSMETSPKEGGANVEIGMMSPSPTDRPLSSDGSHVLGSRAGSRSLSGRSSRASSRRSSRSITRKSSRSLSNKSSRSSSMFSSRSPSRRHSQNPSRNSSQGPTSPNRRRSTSRQESERTSRDRAVSGGRQESGADLDTIVARLDKIEQTDVKGAEKEILSLAERVERLEKRKSDPAGGKDAKGVRKHLADVWARLEALEKHSLHGDAQDATQPVHTRIVEMDSQLQKCKDELRSLADRVDALGVGDASHANERISACEGKVEQCLEELQKLKAKGGASGAVSSPTPQPSPQGNGSPPAAASQSSARPGGRRPPSTPLHDRQDGHGAAGLDSHTKAPTKSGTTAPSNHPRPPPGEKPDTVPSPKVRLGQRSTDASSS